MRRMLTTGEWIRVLGLSCLAATMCGCLQMELAIEMQDEGGATLTERVRFSKPLLDLSRGALPGEGIVDHLKRPAALKRMEQMGKGITLVDHQERLLEDGGRESVTVYRIPDLEDLRIPNPFLQNHPPAPVQRIVMHPCYKSHRSGEVGTLAVSFVRAAPGPGRGEEKGAAPATPLDRQVYRNLTPVVADLARDFQVKVTLTVPNQPARGRQPAGEKLVTLLSFDDNDMDRYAQPFLRNEEAMLALLGFRVDDPAIIEHTHRFPYNPQLPVHRGRRSPYHSDGFRIHPTRYLFGKYFAGRPKAEGGDR